MYVNVRDDLHVCEREKERERNERKGKDKGEQNVAVSSRDVYTHNRVCCKLWFTLFVILYNLSIFTYFRVLCRINRLLRTGILEK